jgi:hypothetical protein
MYREAEDISVDGLCDELLDFYSSYYYCNLEGEIDQYSFIFSAVYNKKSAIKQAQYAMQIGKNVFPDENIVILCSCGDESIDGLLLCYNQDDGSLFIYDHEFDKRTKLEFGLVELFEKLKPFLF